jgi:hypothetical protein
VRWAFADGWTIARRNPICLVSEPAEVFVWPHQYAHLRRCSRLGTYVLSLIHNVSSTAIVGRDGSMNSTLFTRAATFIWANARLLERQLFAYHFHGGSRDAVLAALLAYQNPDGGFGHALEPDIRCPDSQPVPVQHALEILDVVGFEPAVVRRICDYLSSITTPEGGVPWLLPSALAYPRAPWWQTTEAPPASLNPTAVIVGLLHKHQVRHPWVQQATAFCWEKLADAEPTDMHELGVVLEFLYHVDDRQRAEQELARLTRHLLTSGLLAPARASGYVRKPLDWAPTPDHPLRAHLAATAVEAHLDELLASQQPDGGWSITFPAFSPACEFEWRGWVTLATLLTLRANGRLPLGEVHDTPRHLRI